MNPFYDLNKRLADLSAKQDLHESKVAESEKWIQKAVNPVNKGNLHKALHVAQDKTIPKSKIEKATHSKNPKLRHMAQFAKNVANEGVDKEAFAKLAPPTDKITYADKIAGAKKKSKMSEGMCPTCDCAPCKCNEGTTFTDKLRKTPKGGKFKLGDKEYTDTSDIEEGFQEMDAWLAQREKEKGTGKFDKKERTLPGGMKATTYSRREEEPESDDDEEITTITIKKKGRPKSAAPKDSERVTKRSHKYKTVDGKRVKKTDENLDSDGVMMTRPTNCSSESIDPAKQGEYNDEAGMAKDSLHTIVRHARELEQALRSNENLPEWVQEKIGQIKGMMSSVTDYIISTHERDVEHRTGEEGLTTVIPEKAVSKAQRKFMGMAHAIQKGEKIKGASPELKKVAKTMKSSDTHDFAATKEKGLPKKVKKTEEGAKPDFLDVDKDGNKKEPMKKAAADKKDKKEDKVDETTVSGSVATASPSGKSSSGGMQFGKGVYEGFNNQVESMITESIDVTETVTEHEDEGKTITVTASGAEADMLMQLLKAAGLSGSSQGCPTCGQASCGCEAVDEAYGDTDETLNNPDWPTDKETLEAEPNLRTYSGGLNGPKSTGQTTIPVVASQLRRQASMEESVALERSLFKTWKNYKG